MGETVPAPDAQPPAPPPDPGETPAPAPAPQGSSTADPPTPPSGEPDAPAPRDGEAPAPSSEPAEPDWNSLLEKADPDALRKNRRLMGIAGEMASRLAETRANQLLQERLDKAVEERLLQRQAEADRQALLEEARNGNYYQVGQRFAEQAEREELTAADQRAKLEAERSANSEMQAVVDEWAKTMPPDVLQQAAAEYQKAVPAGSRYPQQFRAWLDHFVPTYASTLAEQRLQARLAEERARWEKTEVPALRSRVLAELNGDSPVPDAGAGAPPGVRVVTDEDINRMSLSEWQSIWDAKEGRMKEGVVHRSTRGINTRTPNLGL